MVKRNQTANDAQLKARRTSLEKKSSEELISIILRKDSIERKSDAKIQELQALLKEADTLNEEKASVITANSKMIYALRNEITRLKNLNNLKRKVILTLIGVTITTILTLLVISIL